MLIITDSLRSVSNKRVSSKMAWVYMERRNKMLHRILETWKELEVDPRNSKKK